MFDPDGLALLEKKVADRYAHPVMTESESSAKIHMGLVAGKLERGFKTSIVVKKSPYLDRNEWSASEVIRALRLVMAKYPGKPSYRADIELSTGMTRAGRYSYCWNPRADSFHVWGPAARFSEFWVAPKLGGNLDNLKAANTASLESDKHFSLEHC